MLIGCEHHAMPSNILELMTCHLWLVNVVVICVGCRTNDA